MRFDRTQKLDSHRPSPNTERDYTKEARRKIWVARNVLERVKGLEFGVGGREDVALWFCG